MKSCALTLGVCIFKTFITFWWIVPFTNKWCHFLVSWQVLALTLLSQLRVWLLLLGFSFQLCGVLFPMPSPSIYGSLAGEVLSVKEQSWGFFNSIYSCVTFSWKTETIYLQGYHTNVCISLWHLLIFYCLILYRVSFSFSSLHLLCVGFL